MDREAKDELYIIFSVLHNGKVHNSKEFQTLFWQTKGPVNQIPCDFLDGMDHYTEWKETKLNQQSSLHAKQGSHQIYFKNHNVCKTAHGWRSSPVCCLVI